MSKNKRSKNKGSNFIGTLQRRSKNTHQSTNSPTLFSLKGTLQITRSGMGFVIPEDSKVDGDVMVRPQEFHTALNGDKVEVAVFRENKSTGKKEGKIDRILERKQMEFVGHIELSEKFAFFIADGNKGIPDIYVPLENTDGAENHSKVIVRLIKWSEDRKPLGKVIAKLAQEDINDAAMKELLTENGFPIRFEQVVIDAANALPIILDKKEIKKRKDFRNKLTFTIDPNDSRDFDDAISIHKIAKDKYEIGVHIADVGYYVQPGSILDKEAYKRATSVYLPDRVNPMLPENISNLLCSLRPNEDKFTFSAVFTMNSEGKVFDSWIGKTVIHSDRRYTYDEVQAVIIGGEEKYKDAILILNKMSQSLRAKRFEKGAINFSSHEVRFQLDAKGKPIDIILNETNESHQLIEELMLLANRTVAEYAQKVKIADKPIPFPYRIHDQPDSTKLDPFVAFTKKLGYTFDLSTPDTIAISFNKMLEACTGTPEEMMIQQLGIRTMAKAAYAPENIGHYGLGFKDYCHFTSPIRRYPDVMVHRVLEACLEGKIPNDEEMGVKCKHCSERERASLDTERAANKYKQVEFMSTFVGDDFEAVISGVSNFGFWAETITAKCEGLVNIKDLADFDEFTLMEGEYALIGTRTAQKFRMGDHVWVKVVSANLEKRQIDYQWLPNGISNEVQSKIPFVKTVEEIANAKPGIQNPKDKLKKNLPAKDIKIKTSVENGVKTPIIVSNAKPIKMKKKEITTKVAKAAPKKETKITKPTVKAAPKKVAAAKPKLATVAKAPEKAKKVIVKKTTAVAPAKAKKAAVAPKAPTKIATATKKTVAKKATPIKKTEKPTKATTKAAKTVKSTVTTAPKKAVAKKAAPIKTTTKPTKKVVAKVATPKVVAKKKTGSTSKGKK